MSLTRALIVSTAEPQKEKGGHPALRLAKPEQHLLAALHFNAIAGHDLRIWRLTPGNGAYVIIDG